MTEQGFPPDQIDTSRPHPARMYDYYLGGWDNYEVDRQAAERVIQMVPDARPSARANRDFLLRAVREVVRGGIRQIIDVGTGIPTSPNTHEVARDVDPGVRVAYVDNDPIVATHAGAKLTSAGNTGFVLADVREPEAILRHPVVRELIDFGEPVALLLVAVLHFVKDEEDPAGIIARLSEALPKGSCLVLTHGTGDFHRHVEGDAAEFYRNATAQLTVRGYEGILPFFDGYDLMEPGLVQVPLWRPDGETPIPSELARVAFYGGVGVKH
ncbi:SAM-dependent methyltransferase [Streptomyces sp. AV19]|uniref:SAM-dependent methyltransferase n=1 Tax=Streptomyces sp. AV19 TaxID=2793068 RepID=UPI0018FEEDAB|nr:SAM-dependent methyltransferase [Streptomyces sp. AV19]MBH1938161.1 SAM-dependent methyltransferase [Streptomyces sp. AV19]MDG4534800.1 SAM-dependent methyltransferase [Streptomyces sp. AV19]